MDSKAADSLLTDSLLSTRTNSLPCNAENEGCLHNNKKKLVTSAAVAGVT